MPRPEIVPVSEIKPRGVDLLERPIEWRTAPPETTEDDGHIPILIGDDSDLRYLFAKVIPHLGDGSEEDPSKYTDTPEEAYCALYLDRFQKALCRDDATYPLLVDALELDGGRVEELVRQSIIHEGKAVEASRSAKDLSPAIKDEAAQNVVEQVVRHDLLSVMITVLGEEQVYEELEHGLEGGEDSLFLTREQSERFRLLKRRQREISGGILGQDKDPLGDKRKRERIAEELSQLEEVPTSRQKRTSEIRERCLIPQVDVSERLEAMSDSAELCRDFETRRIALHHCDLVQRAHDRYNRHALRVTSPTATIGDFQRARQALLRVKLELGRMAGTLVFDGKQFPIDKLHWPLDSKTAEEMRGEALEDISANAQHAKEKGASVRKEVQAVDKKVEGLAQKRGQKLIEEELVKALSPLVQHEKPQNWAVMALSAQEAQEWFNNPPKGNKPFEDKEEAARYLKLLDRGIVSGEDLFVLSQGGFEKKDRENLFKASREFNRVRTRLQAELTKIVDGGDCEPCSDIPDLFGQLQEISLQVGRVVEAGEISMGTLTLYAASMDTGNLEEGDCKVLASTRRTINREIEESGNAKNKLAGEVLKSITESFSSSKLAEIPVSLRRALSYQLAELLIASYQKEHQVTPEIVGREAGEIRKDVRASFMETVGQVWGDMPRFEGKQLSRAQKLLLGGTLVAVVGFPFLAKVIKDASDSGDLDLGDLGHDFGSAAQAVITDILQSITPVVEAQSPPPVVIQAPEVEEFKEKAGGTEYWRGGEDVAYGIFGFKGDQNITVKVTDNNTGRELSLWYGEQALFPTKGYIAYTLAVTRGPGSYLVHRKNGGSFYVRISSDTMDTLGIINEPVEPNIVVVPPDKREGDDWNGGPPDDPCLGDNLPPYRQQICKEEASKALGTDGENQLAEEGEGQESVGQGQGTASGQSSTRVYFQPQKKVEPMIGDSDPNAAARLSSELQSLSNQTRVINQRAIGETARQLDGTYCEGQECNALAALKTDLVLPTDIHITARSGDTASGISRRLSQDPRATCHTTQECLNLFVSIHGGGDMERAGHIQAGQTYSFPGIVVVPARGIDPEILDDAADKTLWKQEERYASDVYARVQAGDSEALEQWNAWRTATEQVLREQQQEGVEGTAFIISEADGDGFVKIMVFPDTDAKAPTDDPSHPSYNNTRVVVVMELNPDTGEVKEILPHQLDPEEENTRLAEAQANMAMADEQVTTFLAVTKWNKEVKAAMQAFVAKEVDPHAEEIYQTNKSYVVEKSIFGGTTFVVPEGENIFGSGETLEGIHMVLFPRTPSEGEVRVGSYEIVLEFKVDSDGFGVIVPHEVSKELYEQLLAKAQDNYDQAVWKLDDKNYKPSIEYGDNVIFPQDVERSAFLDTEKAIEDFWTDLEKVAGLSSPDPKRALDFDFRDTLARALKTLRGKDGADTPEANDIWQMMLDSDAEFGTDNTENLPEKMDELEKMFSKNFYAWGDFLNKADEVDWSLFTDEQLDNLRALGMVGMLSLIANSEHQPEGFMQALEEHPVLRDIVMNRGGQIAKVLRMAGSEIQIREIADDMVSGEITRLPIVVGTVEKDGKEIPVIKNTGNGRVVTSSFELIQLAKMLDIIKESADPQKQSFVDFLFSGERNRETPPRTIPMERVALGETISVDGGYAYPQVYQTEGGEEVISLYKPGMGTMQIERSVFDQLLQDPELREAFDKVCKDCAPILNAIEEQVRALEHISEEKVSPIVEGINAVAGAGGLAYSVGQYAGVSPGVAVDARPFTRDLREMEVPSREEVLAGSARRTSEEVLSTGRTGRTTIQQEVLAGDVDFVRADLLQRAEYVEAAASYVEYLQRIENLVGVDREIAKLNPNIPEQRVVFEQLVGQRSELVRGIGEAGMAGGVSGETIAREVRMPSQTVAKALVTAVYDIDGEIAGFNPNLPQEREALGRLVDQRHHFMTGIVEAVESGVMSARAVSGVTPSRLVEVNMLRVEAQRLAELDYSISSWLSSRRDMSTPQVEAVKELRETLGGRQSSVNGRLANVVGRGLSQGIIKSAQHTQSVLGLERAPVTSEMLPSEINISEADVLPSSGAGYRLPRLNSGSGEIMVMTVAAGETGLQTTLSGVELPTDLPSLVEYVEAMQRAGRAVYISEPVLESSPTGQKVNWRRISDAESLELNESGEIVFGSSASGSVVELFTRAESLGVADRGMVERAIGLQLSNDFMGGANLTDLVEVYGFGPVASFLGENGIEEANSKLRQALQGKTVLELAAFEDGSARLHDYGDGEYEPPPISSDRILVLLNEPNVALTEVIRDYGYEKVSEALSIPVSELDDLSIRVQLDPGAQEMFARRVVEEMRYREFVREEEALLEELNRDVILKGQRPEHGKSIQEHVDDETGNTIIIFCDGEEAVGINELIRTQAASTDDIPHYKSVWFVDPEHRERKVNSKLLEYAANYLGTQHPEGFVVEVAIENYALRTELEQSLVKVGFRRAAMLEGKLEFDSRVDTFGVPSEVEGTENPATPNNPSGLDDSGGGPPEPPAPVVDPEPQPRGPSSGAEGELVSPDGTDVLETEVGPDIATGQEVVGVGVAEKVTRLDTGSRPTDHDLYEFAKGNMELSEIVDKYGLGPVAESLLTSADDLNAVLSQPEETLEIREQIRGRAWVELHYREWLNQAESRLSRINNADYLRSTRPDEGVNFQYEEDGAGNIIIALNEGRETVAFDELSRYSSSDPDSEVPRFSTGVFVDPRYRESGYAKMLLEHRIEYLQDVFPEGFTLETVVENQVLREKLGEILVQLGYRVMDQDRGEYEFDSRVDTFGNVEASGNPTSENPGGPDIPGNNPPEPPALVVDPEPRPGSGGGGGNGGGGRMPVDGLEAGANSGNPDKPADLESSFNEIGSSSPSGREGRATESLSETRVEISYQSNIGSDRTTIETTLILEGSETLGTDTLAIEGESESTPIYSGKITYTPETQVEKNTRRLLGRREALMRQQFPEGFVVRQEVGAQNKFLESELLRLGYRRVGEGVYEFDSRTDNKPLTRIALAIGDGSENISEIIAREDLGIVGELFGLSVDQLEAYLASPESHPEIPKIIAEQALDVQRYEVWEGQMLNALEGYNTDELLASRSELGITFEQHLYRDNGLDILLCEGQKAIALSRFYRREGASGATPSFISDVFIDPLERGRGLTREFFEQRLKILNNMFPDGFIHTSVIGQPEFPEKLGEILSTLGYEEVGNNVYRFDSRQQLSSLEQVDNPGNPGDPRGGEIIGEPKAAVEVSKLSAERQQLIENFFSVLKKGREGYITLPKIGDMIIKHDPELARQKLAESFHKNADFAFYQWEVFRGVYDPEVLTDVTDFILFNPSNPQKLNPFHPDAAGILPDFLAKHNETVINLTKELYEYELREGLRERFNDLGSSTVDIGISGLLASGKTTFLEALASDLFLKNINVRRVTAEPEDVEEYYPDLVSIHDYIYGRSGTRGTEATLGSETLEVFTYDPVSGEVTTINIHSGGGHFQADRLLWNEYEKIGTQAFFVDFRLMQEIAENGMPENPETVMSNGESALSVTLSLLDKLHTMEKMTTQKLGVVTKFPAERELQPEDLEMVNEVIRKIYEYGELHIEELNEETIYSENDFVMPNGILTAVDIGNWEVIGDDFRGAQRVTQRLVEMAIGREQLLVDFGDEKSTRQGTVHYKEVLEVKTENNPDEPDLRPEDAVRLYSEDGVGGVRMLIREQGKTFLGNLTLLEPVSRDKWFKEYIESGQMRLVEVYDELQSQLNYGNLGPEQVRNVRASLLNMADELLAQDEEAVWFLSIVLPQVFGQGTWEEVDRPGESNKERLIELRNKAYNQVEEMYVELSAGAQNVRSGLTEEVISKVRIYMKPFIEEAGLDQGASSLLDAQLDLGNSSDSSEQIIDAEPQARVVMLDDGNSSAFEAFVFDADSYWSTWKLSAIELEPDMNLRLYENTEGDILGAILYRVDVESGEIVVDTIESIARRSGVGTALMESVFSEAVAREMMVRVVINREDAHAFYLYLADKYGGETRFEEDGTDIMITTFEWQKLKEILLRTL